MRTRWVTTACAVAVVAVLTGCGGGGSHAADPPTSSFVDEPGGRIAHTAAAAMAKLSSVRIQGTAGGGAQPVTVDVRADRAGDCWGSLSIGTGSAQILASGGRVWLKPDSALMYQLGLGRYDAAVGDRWVAITSANGMGRTCDIGTFLADFATKRRGRAPTVRGTDRVDGYDAVRLVTRRTGRTFTTWVSVATPHHVLKVDVSDRAGGSLVAATFSEFDAPMHVTPPKPAQVTRVPGFSDTGTTSAQG